MDIDKWEFLGGWEVDNYICKERRGMVGGDDVLTKRRAEKKAAERGEKKSNVGTGDVNDGRLRNEAKEH